MLSESYPAAEKGTSTSSRPLKGIGMSYCSTRSPMHLVNSRNRSSCRLEAEPSQPQGAAAGSKSLARDMVARVDGTSQPEHPQGRPTDGTLSSMAARQVVAERRTGSCTRS